jgi:thiamine pyrophosphokinase
MRKGVAAAVPIICADGAANILYKAAPSRVPTHIVGDLDSVLPHVLRHFESVGTQIVRRPSVDAHDFSKAMDTALLARTRTDAPVLVVGGSPGTGRLDQFFGNVQELCVRAEQGVDIWWLDECYASIVLPAGRHRIAIDATVEGPMCGLVPIAGPVMDVTTRGLKYDLTAQDTRFGLGGLVSSSNEVISEVVHIESSGLLLWTFSLAGV